MEAPPDTPIPLIIQIAFVLFAERPGRFELATLCFASTSPRSNDSIPLLRFLMFLTISGNLLLARSKPRDHNNIGFLYSSGSAEVSLVETI